MPTNKSGERQPMNQWIDKEIYHGFKIVAVARGMRVYEALDEALQDWMVKNKDEVGSVLETASNALGEI